MRNSFDHIFDIISMPCDSRNYFARLMRYFWFRNMWLKKKILKSDKKNKKDCDHILLTTFIFLSSWLDWHWCEIIMIDEKTKNNKNMCLMLLIKMFSGDLSTLMIKCFECFQKLANPFIQKFVHIRGCMCEYEFESCLHFSKY